ncbi:hypothetical protein [Pseudooceanicola nitratireducens]|uniref:hypothetical protein n=1 Tax=Pseudooceanicola nitratireducens TaxID=517719 RepID=UPI003C7DD46B
MKNSMIVFLINDDVRAIRGQYEEGGKCETFKTLDQDIDVEDLVVVQSGTRHGMTVVKVTEVDVEPDLEHGPDLKWVVQRIATGAFDDMLAKEEQAITTVQQAEKRRKKAELRDRMFKDHEDQMQALALTNHKDDDPTTE